MRNAFGVVPPLKERSERASYCSSRAWKAALRRSRAKCAGSVDLESLVREVAQDARFEAQERGRGVRVLQASPCVVPGSAPLLRSAIENVVRNAVRHTQENSEVEVSLLCESGLAIVTVRDWGTGVPEQVLGELFKPFYRVESARERGSGGVGLGLAITERAVRAHSGAIEAHNAPGGGLEVEIRLPTEAGREVGGKTAGVQ